MDELFASGIKLSYRPDFSYIYEIGDEKDVSKLHKHIANCSLGWQCMEWAMYHKNISIFLTDIQAQFFTLLVNLLARTPNTCAR
jgi:hypothetical protein